MQQVQPDADSLAWASPALRARLAGDPAGVLRERGITPPRDMPREFVLEFVRITHVLWMEGRLISIEDFWIDPADEGLLFGRGVWESTRTIQGVPWLWNWHLDRLQQTAALLNFPIARERLPSAEQVSAYARALSRQDVVIRLNATAGRPGAAGRIWMSASPRPAPIECLRLQTVPNPIQKGQPYLLLKTFQYATRLRLGQACRDNGYDSALLLDAEGFLQEAAHANIFLRFADGWCTPRADGGFLPGTVRQYLLQNAPRPIREEAIPRQRLAEATEVFVTNSNYGIVPIRQIDDYVYEIGPETCELMAWLHPPEPPGLQYRFQETVPTWR